MAIFAATNWMAQPYSDDLRCKFLEAYVALAARSNCFSFARCRGLGTSRRRSPQGHHRRECCRLVSALRLWYTATLAPLPVCRSTLGLEPGNPLDEIVDCGSASDFSYKLLAAPQACSPAFQNARQRSRTVCSRRRTALSRQTETLFVGFPAHQSVPAARVAVAPENLAKPNEHLLQRP